MIWMPVAHAYNPSYSGGRDQEDHGWRPAQGKCLRDPILKIPNTKRPGGVVQGVGPEFKRWYGKKKRWGIWLMYSLYKNEYRIYRISKTVETTIRKEFR
jgi:hypothetical protein